jgi:putative endonuclease
VGTKTHFVYILASRTRRLYTGVTGNLARRIWQHRTGAIPGFSRRYSITRLVYFEATDSARSAIAREKQIKGWFDARPAIPSSSHPGGHVIRRPPST